MKLIVFDIDGTLSNTKPVDDLCFIKAFKSVFNIDLAEVDWASLQNVTDWGITEEIIEQSWNRRPSTEEFEKMKKQFLNNLEEERISNPNSFNEVPGANAFFNHLKNHPNYTVGLATGAWKASALIKLSTIGINTTGIPFSNSDFHKTRAAICLHTIEQAKVKYGKPFKEIIYFGDGEWDYLTCKKLNIRFIGIDVDGNGILKKLGAEAVFENYLKVNEIIHQL